MNSYEVIGVMAFQQIVTGTFESHVLGNNQEVMAKKSQTNRKFLAASQDYSSSCAHCPE
jgi:hypothetical protein